MVFRMLDIGYIYEQDKWILTLLAYKWLYQDAHWQFSFDNFIVFSSIAIVEAPMVYYFLSIIVGMRDCICSANIIGVTSVDRMTVYKMY